MRKLKLQVQMTVDGYMAGSNGELDWMTWNWDDELKRYVSDLTRPVDCILLGRKMAGGFISHWANVAANADDPEQASGIKFTDTRKVVFTKTLDTCEWDNTELAKGDVVEEVNRLKAEEGGDIIVYGGASFVSSLVEHGLIDEYHLFLNPALLGNGMEIFSRLDARRTLKLANATPFDCGVVALHYTTS